MYAFRHIIDSHAFILLACVAWHSCVARRPPHRSILNYQYSRRWCHIWVTWWCNWTACGLESLRFLVTMTSHLGTFQAFQVIPDLQAVCIIFDRWYWGFKPHTPHPSYFTKANSTNLPVGLFIYNSNNLKQ